MRKTKPEAPKFRSRPKRISAEERRNANIIGLHKEGVSFHQIAKLFEITKEEVEEICRKKVSK
jgi:predicted HTH domain antitoxin